MRKIRVVAALLLTALVCAGCTDYAEEYDKDTLVVKSNGSLVEVATENFKGTGVSAEDLDGYIDEQIQKYNEQYEMECVKKKALVSEDLSKVKLVLQYSTIEDYNAFNALECVLCDYAEADKEILSGSFQSPEGDSVTSDKFTDTDKAKVLVMSEAADLVLGKRILYYNKEVKLENGVYSSSGKGDAVIIFK